MQRLSARIPATVEIKRGRFFGLVAGIAGAGRRGHLGRDRARLRRRLHGLGQGSGAAGGQPASRAAARDDRHRRCPERAVDHVAHAGPPPAGALGLGYALPTPQHGPTMQAVLASMSPQTRKYTQAIMNLTFAQLAAGAAGQP